MHGAVEDAEGVAISTVSYAETRDAFARRERTGDLDDRGLRRAIRAFDSDWRGYIRLAVSNLVAYRGDGRTLCSAGLRRHFLAFDDRLVEAARGASVPVY